LMFVGEDATERAHARSVNYLVAPHPNHVLKILLNRVPLRFLRIRVPDSVREQSWQQLLKKESVVPMHISGGANGVAEPANRPAHVGRQRREIGTHARAGVSYGAL